TKHDTRPRHSAKNQKSKIVFTTETAESIKYERIKRKRDQLGECVPNKNVDVEIWRIEVSSRGQPTGSSSELIVGEQEHGPSGCNDRGHRSEIERDDDIKAQQVPEFRDVVGQRRTEYK